MPLYHFVFLSLVLPGFIANYIYTDLNRRIKPKTQLEEIINALLYSIVVTLTYICLLKYCFHTDSINDLTQKFSSITFVLLSIILNVLLSIVVGLVWHKLHKCYNDIINKIREGENKNKVVETDSLLDIILNDGNDHVVEIINKDNKIIGKGFFNGLHASSREIYIKYPQNVNAERECFTFKEIDGIYFDLNSGVKIVNYRLNRYNEKIEEMLKEF